MTPWKKTAATLLAAICLAAPFAIPTTSAITFSTDNSDLWWNAAESGWGLQMVQRADIIFATLYVYDTNGQPVWYTATLNFSAPSTWTGDLIETNGPWFGQQPFDASAVKMSHVGTMTFTSTSFATGTLTYSIKGTAVNENIERMTLRYDDYSGSYAGLLSYAAEGCPNPFDLGVFSNNVYFEIDQSGTSISIVSQQQEVTPVCTSSGTYGQDGQFGNTSQTCTDGVGAGALMNYYQMRMNPSGLITMNFTAPASNAGSKGCTLNGSLVGIRQ